MSRERLRHNMLVLAIIFFCCLMMRLVIPYFSLRYDVDFLVTKQKVIHLKLWRYSFYVHVFLSIFAIIAGLTQFSKSIVKKNKKLHRAMGYIYVTDVLLLAGPSGLVMSFFANGNALAKTSFVILSILWILCTIMALLKAREKKFVAHQTWMIRSYSLTLSAITLRLLAMVMPLFTHMNAHSEYAMIAWLSWTVNLLIAEIIILKRKKSNLMT